MEKEIVAVPQYYTFKTEPFVCGKCQWSGKGAEMEDDANEYCFPLHCPQCHVLVHVVSYPSDEQVLAHGSQGERESIRKRAKFLAEALESELHPNPITPIVQGEIVDHFKTNFGVPKDVGRLILSHLHHVPDLSHLVGSLCFTWKHVAEETVVECGGVTIWRERAYYEGYHRFRSMACILQQAYGVDRVADLVPDANATLYLYGDYMRAPEHVERTRDFLRRREKIVE